MEQQRVVGEYLGCSHQARCLLLVDGGDAVPMLWLLLQPGGAGIFFGPARILLLCQLIECGLRQRCIGQ